MPLSATPLDALSSEMPASPPLSAPSLPIHTVQVLPNGLTLLAIELPLATEMTVALVSRAPVSASGCTRAARTLAASSINLELQDSVPYRAELLSHPVIQSSLEGMTLTAKLDASQLEQGVLELRRLLTNVTPSARTLAITRSELAERAPRLAGEDMGTHLLEQVIVPRSTALRVDPETLLSVHPAQLMSCMRALAEPEQASLIVVGPLHARDMTEQLARSLADWPRANDSLVERPPIAVQFPLEPRVEILLSRSRRAVLSVGMPAPLLSEPDYIPFRAMSRLLVESPVSALLQRLRHEKGHTYAISHQRQAYWEGSVHQVFVSFEPKLVNRVLRETLVELRRASQRPVDERQCERARQLFMAELSHDLHDADALIALAGSLYLQGLPFAPTLTQWMAQADRLSPESLRQSALRYFDPEHAVYLVTGPVYELGLQMQWGPLPSAVQDPLQGEPSTRN